MKAKVVGAALVALLLVNGAWAADLGSPAPALKVKDWAKGSAVDLAGGKGKNVYVVEFWATWCGPCKASIPHLTDMQKKYKDKGVVFIGVSDEPLATVKPFVDKQGAQMDYVVACDDARATATAYMEAFKIQGIPHAFIVDKQGNIAWHDHPMDEKFDDVIEMVVEGKFDAAARDKVLAAQKEGVDRKKKISGLMKEYFELAKAGNDSARGKGEELFKLAEKDAMVLNDFAWTILTDEAIKKRHFELALRVAKAANDASGGKDAAILDTYARALFDNGKLNEALEYQKKAVALCTDDKMAKELKEALAKYEKAAAEKSAR